MKIEVKYFVNDKEVTEDKYLEALEWQEEIDDEEYIDNLIEEFAEDLFDIKPDECPGCHIREVLNELFWVAFEMGYNAAEDDLENYD
jgi:hypothetical protein